MGDESFARSTPLGFGPAGAAAASTRVGLTDRSAALGVFGAIFGGVLGGSFPTALGTCSAAFGASLADAAFGASLADAAFETSFAGVLGFSAGFFGGVFGAIGIAFFFGGGGIVPSEESSVAALEDAWAAQPRCALAYSFEDLPAVVACSSDARDSP